MSAARYFNAVCRHFRWCFGFLPWLVLDAFAAPLQTQVFDLQKGWNAVYLEVAPEVPRSESVFAGLPLESAWTIQDSVTSVQYLQDPAEPIWNRERWVYHVSTNRLESRGRRLFALQGARPYLLKLTNSARWSVTGVPTLKRIQWQADSFNLCGFPVDPANPPSFETYFKPSPAHYTAASRQLQPIYRLSPSGAWTQVGPDSLMKSGEALWVFCRGASEYQAPFELRLETGTSLEFGGLLDHQSPRLINAGAAPFQVSLRESAPDGAGALTYQRFDPAAGFVWRALPNPLAIPVSPGTNLFLRLGVVRERFQGARLETVLQFNNGAGVRYLIGLSATNALPAGSGAGGNRVGVAGLWVGTATITDVSEAHSGRLITNQVASLPITNAAGQLVSNVPMSILRTNVNLTPRPVRSPFTHRLLVHVDGAGKAKLLKEVVQLWKDGTTKTDDQGRQVVDTPGHYVLLTNPNRTHEFKGVQLRDGELAGRRFSSISYDFPTSPDQNYLNMVGTFAISNSLLASFTLPAGFPTNPFRHKYHPDHNDDSESIAVSRAIQLRLSPRSTNSPPDYGFRQINGDYFEIVGGLHQTNLVAAGTFTLQRVADNPNLDQ